MANSKPILGIPSTMNDSYQLNLRKLFERGCRIQPKNEIVTKINGGYHRISYEQLQLRATKIASSLQKCGIKIGDRIGSFMWNNARHLMLYYAVPSMGCVLHTINIRLHPNELAYLIQHADNQVIFVDADLLPLLEAVPSSAFKNVKKIVVCGENMRSGGWKLSPSSSLPSTLFIDFEVFESTGNSFYAWPDLDERSAMALCYTSGTTGNPKGVAYSHRSTYLHTITAMTADCQGLKGYDCILPLVPMFHAIGWGYPFIALTMGLKVAYVGNTKDYTEILDMCLDEEVNLIAGVPTVMQAFRTALTSNPSKYIGLKGKLTRSICGGSAPPSELIEWYLNNWDIELIQAWGMTETNPMGTCARRIATRRDLENKNGSELTKNQQACGLALPLVELKIVDPNNLDKELEHDGDQSGELLARGPWVTKSYFGNDNVDDKFHNGWLKTGDIASITKKEQMVIKDRSKDMIKSGGEWISSVDMENYVMALSQIDMAVVVAVPHPKWDERPIVICKLNGNIEKEVIMNHLRKRFSKFQLPDEILFW
eukprot:CAMPEP_0201570668 /NCGR_PEP_ID=MMETSP0190_2-20130828/13017_1 /ASSEMBLY_ACC=CAM_ASM_000263 /TAXON_ID=37353 /ORGANISM="Rosalina sp." /LENGTH=539 /DNA_ID=CAMNT_0047994439 /DNA_START=13 /DNA_END=1629 /DNA_ORIENTATION=+